MLSSHISILTSLFSHLYSHFFSLSASIFFQRFNVKVNNYGFTQNCLSSARCWRTGGPFLILDKRADSPPGTITDAVLGDLTLAEQYSAAAYCSANVVTANVKVACSSGNCPKVEGWDANILTAIVTWVKKSKLSSQLFWPRNKDLRTLTTSSPDMWQPIRRMIYLWYPSVAPSRRQICSRTSIISSYPRRFAQNARHPMVLTRLGMMSSHRSCKP
jgi:hypothetical protein